MSPRELWQEKNKELEAICNDYSRDETGAFREEMFHQKALKYVFENLIVKPDRSVELSDDAKDLVFIGITNRDLPRANSEKGHLAGDHVLTETAKSINTISKNSQVFESGVFHTRGADFVTMVTGDTDKIEEITQALKSQEIHFEGESEPAKLSVSTVSVRDIIEEHNNSTSSELNSPTQIKKELVGKLLETLSVETEKRKVIDGINDISEKMRADPTKGEEYYIKYWSYYFSSSKRPFIAKDFEDLTKDEIQELAKELAEKNIIEEQHPDLTLDGYEDLIEEFSESSEYEEHLGGENIIGYEEFAKRFKTMDRENIDGILRIYDMLSEKLENETLTIKDWGNIHVLATYLQMNDLLTELVGETASFYLKNEIIPKYDNKFINSRNMSEEFPVPMSREQIEDIHHILETVGKGILAYQLRVDRLTGINSKMEFSRTLSSWLKEKGLDQNFSVVSLDLGYLKYFNQFNGRQSGDIAIQTAAHILETVQLQLNDRGIKCEIFRTGGDEFSMIIDQSAEESAKVIPLIQALSNQIGVMPPKDSKNHVYIPEKIRFGIGVCDTSQTIKLLREAIENNDQRYSPEDIKALKETIENPNMPLTKGVEKIVRMRQVEVADTIQDQNKTRARFFYVLEKYQKILRLRNFNQKLSELEKKRFEIFLGNSGKALKGKNIEDLNNLITYAESNGIDWQNPSNISDEEEKELFGIFFGTPETVTEIV